MHFPNEKSSWGLFIDLYCLFTIYIFSLIKLVQIWEVLRVFFYCYILRAFCICWVKVLNLSDSVLIVFVCFSVYGLTLNLWKSSFKFWWSSFSCFYWRFQELVAKLKVTKLSPVFSPRHFIVSGFTWKSITYFGLICESHIKVLSLSLLLLAYGYSTDLATFAEKTILSSL